MKKELFEIQLEDYCFPRHVSEVRSYYGTMNDIINLAGYLSDNKGTRTRYQETIDAIENYELDHEIMHTVAGQVFPILTPVEEVARFETQITNKLWNFTAYDGIIYPCCADCVDICQILIRTENDYRRCLKASITGLKICHAAIGWYEPVDAIHGFPGMVNWDGEYHTMSMFVPQTQYKFEDQEKAFSDLVDVGAIDLSITVRDILATG